MNVTAYFTMDDGPTKNTPKILDYLESRAIRPIFFFVGQDLEEHYAEGLEAVRRGAIIGNHLYRHEDADETTFEAYCESIEKMEALIEKLYHDAGVARPFKILRMPFGTRGKGKDPARYQAYVRAHGFVRIDDRKIALPRYLAEDNAECIDVAATFGFEEWRMINEPDFRLPQIFSLVRDAAPENNCPLLVDGSHQIVVLHDHDFTNDIVPEYYRILLDDVIQQGVHFIDPAFLAVKP